MLSEKHNFETIKAMDRVLSGVVSAFYHELTSLSLGYANL